MSIEPYRPQYPSQPAQTYPVNPYTPVYGPIVTPEGHDPVVYVPNAYGELVPMLKSQIPVSVQPAPVRDLTPQPVIDPRAQILAGGGVAAAGLGWGASELLSAMAGFGAGTVTAIVAVLLAVRLGPGLLRSGGQGNTYVTNTTTNVKNTNRWLGRSTTNVSNR